MSVADTPSAAGRASSDERATPARKPEPPKINWIDDLGGMFLLGGKALRQSVKRPFGYGPEFLNEIGFMLRIATVPMLLMSFALSFGPAGIQASNFLGLFGAIDRLGAAYVLITVREFAPLVTGIILAGAVGTAMCADLGAREVRGETDALRVLGVDPIKNLVVPRLLTVVFGALLFNVLSLVTGVLGALVVVSQNHAAAGPFFSTFFHNATTLEFAAAMLKCAVYGVIIAITACYKGMNVSGGSEGVGRAVNETVVIAFLAIGVCDFAFTQILLAYFPELSQVRG